MKGCFSITIALLIAVCTAVAQPVVDNERGRGTQAQRLEPYAVPEASGSRGTAAPHIGAQPPQALSAQGNTTGWLPMAQGLPGRVLTTAVLNDDLYAIVEMPYQGSNGWWAMGFYKWDGTVWTTLGLYEDIGDARGTLVVYRGEIYYGGYFKVIGGVTGFRGLARWDGTQWVPVRGGVLDQCTFSNFYNLNVIGDKLYGAGVFNLPGRTTGILQYDGTTISEVGTFPGLPIDPALGATGTVLYNGELYLSGRFSSGGMTALARWDGNTWSAVSTASYAMLRMEAYNGRLYCFGAYSGSIMKIMSWDGTSWRDEVIPEETSNLMDFQIYHDDLYISTTGANNVVARLGGTAWEVIGSFDNDVYDMEIFRDRLFASGWFTVAKDAPATQLNYVALYCDDSQCGSITGTVFNDHNDDCVKGDGEPGMRRRMIEILPGPVYTMTGADGTYGIPLTPGSYTVGLVPRDHWTQNCPALNGTHSVAITAPDDSHEDISFGVRAVADIEDIRVSMVAGPARPGRSFLYYIAYENVGTVTTNGTISLTLDPILTVESSDPSPTRINGSLLQWDFTDLEPGEVRAIKVLVRVPPATSIGTLICSDAVFESNMPPLYMPDDRDSVCVEVTGSYDPNDISVKPIGYEGVGMITADDSVLTYTVRFQNTGNDTAFRVVVIDTVSSALDLRSLRLGAASHDYTFSVKGSNILVWVFDNIMLPHKDANEPGSHGMFKYSLRQKPGLANGTVIPNRAGIYFDYNAPVITNTVVSTIAAPMDVEHERSTVEVRVVPNPSTGLVSVEGQMRSGGEIAVLDLLGRRMMSVPVQGGVRQMIDLSGLPAGPYMLAVPSVNGTMLRQVIVVR